MPTTALVLACTSVTGLGQEAKSEPMAKELTALMAQRKMDNVAARMPNDTDRFVAALYIADSSLFVVSARYGAPSLVQEQIWNRSYQDVYAALNGAGMRKGKLFVQDLAPPGLQPTRAETGSFDIVFEEVSKRTAFDGDWRAQKLSEAEYMKRFEAIDARYAKILGVLVSELKAASNHALFPGRGATPVTIWRQTDEMSAR